MNRQEYQQYLDEIAPPFDSEEWIIGGKMRSGSYGAAIRKNDPIAFEIGLREYNQESEYRSERATA